LVLISILIFILPAVPVPAGTSKPSEKQKPHSRRQWGSGNLDLVNQNPAAALPDSSAVVSRPSSLAVLRKADRFKFMFTSEA
jgi:hypothetical protein